MKLNREQCMGLVGAVSMSAIDVFELSTGGTDFKFRRKTAAVSTGDSPRAEIVRTDVMVTSPVLGIFRTSPDSGASPYVRIGQAVAEQDVLCSVDVLDNRHDVPAGVCGHVTRVMARHGELVEYGQCLAVVRIHAQGE